MRRLIVKLVVVIMAVAGATGFVCARVYAAQNTSSSSVGITIPHEGESVVESNVQISGTAPPGVLVEIQIIDTDASRRLIQHQRFGKVSGNVTSDEGGVWLFTPQQALVPGQFSVQAYYTTTDNQKISSKTVQFVVTTPGGSSGRLSQRAVRAIWVLGGVLLMLIIWLPVHFIRRRRRGKRPASGPEEPLVEQDGADKPEGPLFFNTPQGRRYKREQDAITKSYEVEALKIEEELARTAEELEQVNAKVVSLRHELASEQSGEPEKARGKPRGPKTNIEK